MPAPLEALAKPLVPPRRRGELSAVPPVRAELVVLPSLLGIAKNLVGLPDLLEPFLRLALVLVLVPIRMPLPGNTSVRVLDLLLRRVPLHTENLVVILVLNSHPVNGLLRPNPGPAQSNSHAQRVPQRKAISNALQKRWLRLELRRQPAGGAESL